MYEKGKIGSGTIVITADQAAGRGQRGNVWISEKGQNLTFSLVLIPDNISPSQIFLLNIVASLAVRKSCQEMIGDEIKIKWPNDIYAGNQKIGGILIETSILGNSVSHATIGIGLNVNQKNFPGYLQAASLSMLTGRHYELNQVFNHVVKQLDQHVHDLYQDKFDSLRLEYTEDLYWQNEMHSFRAEREFTGRIKGIDEFGRLIIQTKEGLRKFNVNEISYLK